MNSEGSTGNNRFDYRFAKMLYQWRWLTAIFVLCSVIYVFMSGMENIGRVTKSVLSISDISDGSGQIAPQMFDPSLDVWFDTGDATVKAYFDIEDRFIAEDYILVTLENTQDPYGVFSRESLETIQRLTENFLTVPGVRHVRSLTYSPWIRWGSIDDGISTENGLIISDLVESPATQLSDKQLVERMVAVLGANRTAKKIGAQRVREYLGNNANFDDFQGEPLLLDAIVNQDASATAIQIQITRPVVEGEHSELTKKLYSVQFQRAALRGIEHFLNIESGLSLKTTAFQKAEKQISALPESEDKRKLKQSLSDPSKNFMVDQDGQTIQKYRVFRLDEDGHYLDIASLNSEFKADSTFTPNALSPYNFKLGGVPVLERNFEVVGSADSKFLPLMFLVITIFLIILTRSFAGTVIPMVVVLASIFGTVGTIFATGTLFNNLTAMMPNMMTAIGVADSIHLVAAWLLMRSQYDNKAELIIEVIRKNAAPVLLTTITTAIGFYSLMLNDLTPVKQLAWSMAIGTFIAYLLTMTVVPLMLSLFPHSKRKRIKQRGAISQYLSTQWAALIIRHRAKVVGYSSIVALISCIGLFFVQIDADQRKMFTADNPVILDLIWIEEHLGGTGDLEIIFNSTASDSAEGLNEQEAARLESLQARNVATTSGISDVKALSSAEMNELNSLQQRYEAWNNGRIGVSAQFLQQVEQFEYRLREEMVKPDSTLSIITDLSSPLDILKKMHQVQNNDNPAFYRAVNEGDVSALLRQASVAFDELTEEYTYIPSQTASTLISQYWLQYENGARPGETLSTQLSVDRQHYRMQGRGLLCTTQEKQAAIAKIREIAENEFPDLIATPNDASIADLTVSGKKTLMDRTGIIIAESFSKSIVVALIVILIVISLFFRSWKLGLVSALPNVLPIAIPLGFFGWFGIMIDGPAIAVAVVALGVCVDDTIHFFTKYSRAINSGKTVEQAISETMRECGDALTLTTIVLIVGFSTMLLSSFSPNYLMGVLAVSMIALAWLADFIVTPAVLAMMDIKSSEKKDTATDSLAYSGGSQ